MDQHDINYRAVRAFRHAARDLYALAEVGAFFDEQIDGGEWSRSLNARRLERDELKLANRIGMRFGINGQDLLDQTLQAAYIEEGLLMDAILLATINGVERRLSDDPYAYYNDDAGRANEWPEGSGG